MKDAAEVLKAIATLAWPLIVVVLLLRFSGALKVVLESAARRKFSLKIAGNELSMDEFSEQQIKLLSDLQAKVADLETKVAAAPTAPAASEDVAELAPEAGSRILWVDDNPRNNSYLVAVIEERGGRVDTALSTEAAIRKFANGRYDAIISDMGRPESEHAGLDLADRIRTMDPAIPILIFCGGWAARNMQDEALSHGVNLITSSGSKLLSGLAQFRII